MLITVKPKKVALYMANGRYTAQQVRALTGADVVINGTLYTFATMKPCQDVKANGVVYADEYYHYSGFGWNNNSVKLQHSYDMDRFDNFFSCCDIIFNGQICNTDDVAWVQGARQRTAIGLTPEGDIVVYATQYNTTIAQVKQVMREARCVEAINLDGGGSTQISAKGYGELYSSRRVQNYICIWIAAPDSSTQVTSCPYAEPTMVVRKGSNGEGARWVQWHLRRLGYRGSDGKVIEVDGQFGRQSDWALREFQKKNGLNVDGICGEKSRKKLRES